MGEIGDKRWRVGMFMGEFQHTVDAKGRIFMPAKMKEDLGASFIITKGTEGCLFVYNMEEWEKLKAKFATFPMSNKKVRAVARFLFGGATEAEPDKQGRVILPQTLRDFAQITKNVVTVGVGNRAEIWAQERWQEYIAETDDEAEQMLEDLTDLGI